MKTWDKQSLPLMIITLLSDFSAAERATGRA